MKHSDYCKLCKKAQYTDCKICEQLRKTKKPNFIKKQCKEKWADATKSMKEYMIEQTEWFIKSEKWSKENVGKSK